MFKTPILQVTKSCSSQLNNILLNRPPFGKLALGLASLAGKPAEVICFPVKERRQEMITQRQAMGQVAYALKTGKLTRATVCETCGAKPAAANKNKAAIIGHHWQGYDKPLDVLWVCPSCNILLAHKHDGSLTKEQAKVYVRERQRLTIGRRLGWFK